MKNIRLKTEELKTEELKTSEFLAVFIRFHPNRKIN